MLLKKDAPPFLQWGPTQVKNFQQIPMNCAVFVWKYRIGFLQCCRADLRLCAWRWRTSAYPGSYTPEYRQVLYMYPTIGSYRQLDTDTIKAQLLSPLYHFSLASKSLRKLHSAKTENGFGVLFDKALLTLPFLKLLLLEEFWYNSHGICRGPASFKAVYRWIPHNTSTNNPNSWSIGSPTESTCRSLIC